MAIGTPVNLGTTSGSAGTTLILTTIATAAVGDLIVVATNTVSTATSACVDSAGNTYTAETNTLNNTKVWRTIVTTQLPSGGTITVTKGNAIGCTMAAVDVTGIAAVPLDVVHSSSGSSSTPSDSQTTLNDNDIIFGVVGTAGTVTKSIEGTGFTGLTDVLLTNANLFWGYRIESATGTFNYNPTLSGATSWADLTESYKAAASAASSLPQLMLLGVGT